MLSKKENEMLTRVGPGTPAGELLRRYWHPVSVAAEFKDVSIKRVRILGEDLVLYHDGNGEFGVVAEQCSHRGASLAYGTIEGCNIRCRYHGWLYDRDGRCLDQPAESPDNKYKNKIRHPAYPVKKLAGLLFAYLGPKPAPLLPRWDVLVRPDGRRIIHVLPRLDCNWLQPMENSVDPSHTFYLHANRVGELKYDDKRVEKIEFERFEYGIMKKRFVSDGSGLKLVNAHPLVFPNMLRNHRERHYLEYRVPIDDSHTLLFNISFYPSRDGSVDEAGDPPVEYVPPYKDADGLFQMDKTFAQDYMAWETAGPIYDRTKEHLSTTDKGILALRKLLKEQIKRVESGRDPLGVLRDPAQNNVIHFDTAYVSGT